MSRWLRLFAAPTYQNTGSVARDHLASERTFLAWLRTGLGLTAFGMAVERVSQLDLEDLVAGGAARARHDDDDEAEDAARRARKRDARVLAGALAGLGAGSIVYGTARYFANLRALEGGRFRPAYHGVAVVGGAVAALAAGVYAQTGPRRRRDEAERPDVVGRYERPYGGGRTGGRGETR